MDRKEMGRMQQEFIETNPTVKGLLEVKTKKSVATAKQYSHHLYHYFQWLRQYKSFENMQQVVEDFNQNSDKYAHIDLMKEYLFSDSVVVKSLAHRRQCLSALRAFYRFNRCKLPDERIDLNVTEIDKQNVRERLALEAMTLEDVRTLISPMQIREQGIMLIQLQSGMGVGEFVNEFNICTCRKEWLKNNGHVCEPVKVMKQLKEGKKLIKIEIIGRKKNPKPYFTFIGNDAIQALKRYLVYRANLIRQAQKKVEEYERVPSLAKRVKKIKARLEKLTPEWSEGEPLFVTNWLNPIHKLNIQETVKQYKKRTGLTNKEFTPHSFRDIFKTECAHAGVKDEISEFFIGHMLDKYGYNRLKEMHPEDFEVEYKKVQPVLDVISRGTISAKRLTKLEMEVKEKAIMVEALVKNEVGLKTEKEAIRDQLNELREQNEWLRLQVETLQNTLRWFIEVQKKQNPQLEEEYNKRFGGE